MSEILTKLRESAAKASTMSSDDFGHNCQLLLEAESTALQEQCDVVIKLCDALELAIEQRDYFIGLAQELADKNPKKALNQLAEDLIVLKRAVIENKTIEEKLRTV